MAGPEPAAAATVVPVTLSEMWAYPRRPRRLYRLAPRGFRSERFLVDATGILKSMRREEAISSLRSFLPALKRDFGVRRICLFGSTVRDEARPNSDLDLLVDFEVGPTFDSFMGLKFFLEDHLGQRVDLVTPDALKPRLRPVVEREAVDVA